MIEFGAVIGLLILTAACAYVIGRQHGTKAGAAWLDHLARTSREGAERLRSRG